MADDKKTTDTAPEGAFQKALRVYQKVEAALRDARAEVEDDVHEETASLRGNLATCLAVLQNGKPGGS